MEVKNGVPAAIRPAKVSISVTEAEAEKFYRMQHQQHSIRSLVGQIERSKWVVSRAEDTIKIETAKMREVKAELKDRRVELEREIRTLQEVLAKVDSY